jgi:NAD(P)-dependent dehydrogenase (short-subunit alcohol dehydrogenase family)
MAAALAGRTAFVSGSSSGIGAAIATELAAQGASVVIHGRDRVRAERVARAIQKAGGTAHVAIGDLTDDAAAGSVAEQVLSAAPAIDILINVAGGAGTEGWSNSTAAVFEESFQTNLASAVRLIGAFLPGMRTRRWGRIVQIGSIAAQRPMPDQVPAYCAAKAGLAALTSSLAMTVAGEGVNVNTVSPGYIVTPLLKDYFLAMPENAGRDWAEIEPAIAEMVGIRLGRLGRPEEVAAMVAFLVGPGGDWITGSNFRIDGGNLCAA